MDVVNFKILASENYMDIGVILPPGFMCGNVKALLPQKAQKRCTFEMLSTFNFSLEYNVIFAFKAKIAFSAHPQRPGFRKTSPN